MKYNFKKYAAMALSASLAMGMVSCNDWLTEDEPGKTKLEDFFIGGSTAINNINGCYTPLSWEFNHTYYSEWYFGDIPSDDALKGGQNVSDGTDAYDFDNFKTNVSNTICLDYYRAKYQGIQRCNLALQIIPEIEPDEAMTESRKTCLLGEAHFLRGLYYFQLVRVFGGVPLVDKVLDSADDWQQPRATAEEIYNFAIDEFKLAESMLWNKSKYPAEDLGRATKGAAQAMLCKAYLYKKDYRQAYTWGKKWVDEQYNAGEYSLCPVYADNFTLEGENGCESILEIQYMAEGMSDYGGNGFTRGSFTTRLVRPRFGSDAGWGWNHPTQNLYDEFEPNDLRREVTIGTPTAEFIDVAEVNYLGNPYYNNKYAYMLSETAGVPLDHDSRSPRNYILMRAADALLLYAEAALESGADVAAAKWALEEVRARARANSADPTNSLPAFPDYLGFTDTNNDLRKAIRHERRVELGMEGHRWFDIVRWGIAAQLLNKDNGTYASNESDAVRAEMANFIEGKHELFPIPLEEIQLNPMEQNPGY